MTKEEIMKLNKNLQLCIPKYNKRKSKMFGVLLDNINGQSKKFYCGLYYNLYDYLKEF